MSTFVNIEANLNEHVREYFQTNVGLQEPSPTTKAVDAYVFLC